VADGASLARLERYLAELPGGLDAYPAVQAKGSVVRNVLEGQPAEALAAAVPPALGRLVLDPPVTSDWVPEAHLGALLHAVADVRGMTDDEVCAWARAQNRALFESPAYRILMAVMSPASLVRFAGGRWENFHRGTRLEVEGASDDGVRVTLEFPPGLFDPFLLRVFGQAFTAALELSHAASPQVIVEWSGPESARYLARW